LEEVVELFGEYILMYFVLVEGALEGVLAAFGFAALVLDGGGEVFEGLGLLLGLVMKDGACLGVDAKGGFAAGAEDVDRGRRLGHVVSLSKAVAARHSTPICGPVMNGMNGMGFQGDGHPQARVFAVSESMAGSSPERLSCGRLAGCTVGSEGSGRR